MTGQVREFSIIRTAITDIKPASPIINTISSISPVGITLAVATKLVTDKNLGTGEAASEIEVVDSVTGERLVADVDRRQGGKMIFRDRWTDAKNAFDHWAKRLRSKLESMCCSDRKITDFLKNVFFCKAFFKKNNLPEIKLTIQYISICWITS